MLQYSSVPEGSSQKPKQATSLISGPHKGKKGGTEGGREATRRLSPLEIIARAWMAGILVGARVPNRPTIRVFDHHLLLLLQAMLNLNSRPRYRPGAQSQSRR